jgi:hypothetical protein
MKTRRQWMGVAVWLATSLVCPVVLAESPAAEGEPASRPPAASLYVFNISGPTLFTANQDVTDNGTLIASLPRLTHTVLAIAPGAHELRFQAFPRGNRVATLSAEPGHTYYLVVGYSPTKSWAFPFLGDSMLIKVVEAAEAEALIRETKPVGAR